MEDTLKNLTKDCILDGKLILSQPRIGYRIPIDPIILAAFVENSKAKKILDVGCGAGTISLILKYENPKAEIMALDVDSENCEICRLNSVKNSLPLNVIDADLAEIEKISSLKNVFFDLIVTNPPYFKEDSSRVSPEKKLSKFETMPLNDWISLCLKKLSPRGTFAIIHDAARIDDIIFALKNFREPIGAIEIFPIYSRRNDVAKRIIVRCKKNSKKSPQIFPPLIVHDEDGKYSSEAAYILSGNFLNFSR